MGADGGPIRRGPVGDDHLDLAAPPVPLSQEEPRQGPGVSAADHPQTFTRLPIQKDGDVAVAAPQRRFVHHQNPAAATTTSRHHQIRPAPHHSHDVMPRKAVAARHLPDGEMVDVSDQLTGQTTSDMGAPAHQDLGMVLPRPLHALVADEAAADPHQGGRTAPSRKIHHLEPPAVMHPMSLEPTMRAANHPTNIGHLHHQLLDHIHQHRHHTDAAQMKTDSHSIRCHQGPSFSATYITEYRGALTLNLALPPTCSSPPQRGVSIKNPHSGPLQSGESRGS